ncbi:MAG: beta-ketoacyl-[acyl-carrier-protein] synthase II [Chloroflexi bacterium RBG_19FT_COMBO_55_16]|nr:MAG: beta-ketoacyl-[acyl-carrier-protein] synthase II [Chloroflexi bacterium RBG_19FT_COMBO_55_16]
MPERIVITGLGTVNPLGLSVQDTWQNTVQGVSGVGPITLFDARDYLVQIACEVKNFNPELYLSPKEARRRDRFEQLAVAAAQEAIRQASLEVGNEEAERVGVMVSSAIGGLNSFQDSTITVLQEGPRRINPYVIPMLMTNGAAGMIAIDYGYKGPCFSVASACASGADGIGIAWTLLRLGVIDTAIAGASEATISPVGVAAFDRVGAMSRRNEEPPQTPQPFDRNRDGLVMGEGAAILVLETEARARARGVKILAELAGYAATADSFHITAPAEDGSGGARAMDLALQAAGINPEEVDYINAHGTGTQLNDLSETRAIKTAFGNLADQIPVSSTKSMTGHMMGATGALEAIFCVQAVRHDLIPPTINYQTPDPECDLDYVPNIARERPVRVALSNAFGFGGHNAVLVIREYN